MNSLNIRVDFNDNPSILPPNSNFHYVDQGNYLTLPLLDDQPLTVYSDSATSCIITVVVASTGSGNTVTLAHLDSPECIEAFFGVIEASNTDDYRIMAQGANPPGNDISERNANQLNTSIDALGSKVSSVELSLSKGSPLDKNRGDFGLSFDGKGNVIVSNQPYTLQLFQRDPSCGGQTVYCIMRRQEQPPVQIRDAGLPFTHSELVELASIALQFRKIRNDPTTAFTNIVNMENEEIRNDWSTTPEYEAPWFSDQLKLGAAFSIAMAPVVSLSEQHLIKTTAPSFSRLRDALLAQH